MMLLAVTIGFDCVAVFIWMKILFMLEKLHGPINHQECSHDAATSSRIKSLFASCFQVFIHTYDVFVVVSLVFELVALVQTWLQKHYATQHYFVLVWALSTTH